MATSATCLSITAAMSGADYSGSETLGVEKGNLPGRGKGKIGQKRNRNETKDEKKKRKAAVKAARRAARASRGLEDGSGCSKVAVRVSGGSRKKTSRAQSTPRPAAAAGLNGRSSNSGGGGGGGNDDDDSDNDNSNTSTLTWLEQVWVDHEGRRRNDEALKAERRANDKWRTNDKRRAKKEKKRRHLRIIEWGGETIS